MWLAEWLSEVVAWKPGGNVLDLGCGMAASSIFLAREYGLQVTAADLWIDSADNTRRIADWGLSDQIEAVSVDARELGFPLRSFDAVVSIDAFHYFGTEDGCVDHIAGLIRPGGFLALVVPSVIDELDGAAPVGLEPWWAEEMFTFHTPAWWRQHLEREGLVVTAADWLDDGWRDWLLWCEVCGNHLRPSGLARGDDECAEMLRADAGKSLGLARLLAQVR